ncbi:MAG: PDZ domain-containing protein [Verrucomicrobiota bacterium]
MRRLIPALALALLLGAAGPPPAAARALDPGSRPGTWKFESGGRVLWYRQPPGEVLVHLCDFTGRPLHRAQLGEDGSYELSAELRPGSYFVQADVEPAYQDLFWPDRSQVINVSETGEATTSHAELFLMEKMEPLGPQQDEVVSDPQPVLRWKAMPQAREYRVDVEIWNHRTRNFDALGKPIFTSLTFYQLPKPLKRDSIVRWSVHARNRFGERFAGWREGRFLTPGGARLLEKELNRGELVTALGQENLTGRPWLGISISPSDPRVSYEPREDEGILVHSVGNQSPASAGGLQPGDVILRYEGIRVFRVEDFLQLVQYSNVGSEVKLDVNRGGRSQTLKVEVGRRP